MTPSDTHSSGDITILLTRLRAGDRSVEDELISLVYPALRRLARRHLHGERPGNSLQATALVHEAYLRLAGYREPNWQNRSHFLAVASGIMRRILVDHARGRKAEKRGGEFQIVELNEFIAPIFDDQSSLVLELDECLKRLAALDARQAKIVEMRFFGGLTEDETASVLGVSTRTVNRDWVMAKAWLHAELRST